MLEGIGRFGDSRYGFCIIQLCHGKADNRDFYAFVAIEPQNYPFFKKNYRPGVGTNFAAYGRELLRGWGLTPPQDIIDHVSRKHNVDFIVTGPNEEEEQEDQGDSSTDSASPFLEKVTASGAL
jgi:hypothetical protein